MTCLTWLCNFYISSICLFFFYQPYMVSAKPQISFIAFRDHQAPTMSLICVSYGLMTCQVIRKATAQVECQRVPRSGCCHLESSTPVSGLQSRLYVISLSISFSAVAFSCYIFVLTCCSVPQVIWAKLCLHNVFFLIFKFTRWLSKILVFRDFHWSACNKY